MNDNTLILAIILVCVMCSFTYCGDPDIHDGIILKLHQEVKHGADP